jgi:hypothetical protein
MTSNFLHHTFVFVRFSFNNDMKNSFDDGNEHSDHNDEEDHNMWF